MEKNQDNNFRYSNIFYLVPLCLMITWGAGSLISAFLVNYRYFGNGFVIFSSLCKIVMSLLVFYFLRKVFFTKEKSVAKYKRFCSFVGYGIVVTYVFYSFPRIVVEYYEYENNQLYVFIDFIVVLFLTILPIVLYVFLKTNKSKLILGGYSQIDFEYELKIKRDKVFKKKRKY